jgi:hypothetical protein
MREISKDHKKKNSSSYQRKTFLSNHDLETTFDLEETLDCLEVWIPFTIFHKRICANPNKLLYLSVLPSLVAF